MVSYHTQKQRFLTLFAQSSCDYYSHFYRKSLPPILQKILMFPSFAQQLSPERGLFRLRRCFRQGRVHQYGIRANGLDLLPWDGQALVPAQQPEQPGPAPAGSGFAAGRWRGQRPDHRPGQGRPPAPAAPPPFHTVPGWSMPLLPFLPQLMQPPGRIMQKAVETAWQIVVY